MTVVDDEKPVTVAGIDKIGKYSLVYVVQTDAGNRFVAAMLYQSTFSSVGGVPSWTSEPCKRTDTLYRDTLDGNFNFPACLMVNHVTNFWDPASKRSAFDAKIMTWYQDRNVQLPTRRYRATTPNMARATLWSRVFGSTRTSQA